MAVAGATSVAGLALRYASPAAKLHPVLVNGGAGVIATVDGRPLALMAFTVAGGRVVEIDAINDPERVAAIARDLLPALG
jgi:hypothetical protein